MSSSPSTPLRLAATALPIRDTSTGLEVLMVKRNQELTFGGMWTFPGGVFEPEDGPVPEISDEFSTNWASPAMLATAANAAARETREETAIRVSTATLAWYSHWIPPTSARKRYATWFFLAPESAGEVEVDERENSDARWVHAGDAIANRAGDLAMIAPTWCTLYDIAKATTVSALLDETITQGPRYYHTRLQKDAGKAWLVWPGDAAYESGELDADGDRNRAAIDREFRVIDRVMS